MSRFSPGLLLLLILSLGFAPQAARPQPGAATIDDKEHEGTLARCALPEALQTANVGGSDGAGLCVFTSIGHAGRFQGLDALADMQQFMRSRPGGGWPEKVDRMLAEKLGPDLDGIEYVHLYGEECLPVLELVIADGLLPCITYGFGERYGLPAIDHMVNLVHLDDEWACVLDNNFTGDDAYEWMSRDEFIRRFGWSSQGAGEGWAVVFLASPQPPEPGPDTSR